jgi:hypothetical protein
MSAGTPQTPTAVLPKGFQYGYATGEFCCMTAEHTYEYIVFQRLMLHASCVADRGRFQRGWPRSLRVG